MKNLLVQIFTWWNGQTIGTRFATWRFGKRVGEDELGNVITKAVCHPTVFRSVG